MGGPGAGHPQVRAAIAYLLAQQYVLIARTVPGIRAALVVHYRNMQRVRHAKCSTLEESP